MYDVRPSLDRVDDEALGGSLRVRVLGVLVRGARRRGAARGWFPPPPIVGVARWSGRVESVSIDVIVDALWGDDPPPSAGKTIQSHVMRLRRSLADVGSDVLETVPSGYRLNVDPAAVDAERFMQMAAEGRRALDHGRVAVATGLLSEALELWRGPAYVEFRDAEFAVAEGVRLDELRLAAMEDLAEAELSTGAVATAVAELERLVVEDPGRERAWALLMQGLYAAGRQQQALGAFQRARRALAEQFGLEPGVELRDLERKILDQDPALPVAGERSLLPSALRSSSPFVGRIDELAELRQTWDGALRGSGRLGVVLGPVDSGRTRLVGELASAVVEQGGWVDYVRGADGFASLVTASSEWIPVAGRGRRRGHRSLPARPAAARRRRRRVDAVDRCRRGRGGRQRRRAADPLRPARRRSVRRRPRGPGPAPPPRRGHLDRWAAGGRGHRAHRRQRRGGGRRGRRHRRRRRRHAGRRPAGGGELG